MPGYFDYYSRTINEHQTGLKLVGGGTGLGKTSSIPRVVEQTLQLQQKAIYVANRTQLLDEMDKATPDSFSVLLPRDLESVRVTLSSAYRSAFDNLMMESFFRAHTEFVDLANTRRSIQTLDEIFNSSELGFMPHWQEQTADNHARQILRDFKTITLTANSKSKTDHKRLIHHPIIQQLFPFIAFKLRPEARLLLVTLHKLFYGFFDGEKTITAVHLKNYIIFADEFDFLENDLIQLITRSRQIDDPLRFVEFFYREMQRHKLQLENYPVSGSPDIKRRIEKVMYEIDLLHMENIHYPEINQFISTDDPNDVAIFRTSHTISSSPIYLCETDRAFRIVADRDQCTEVVFSARRLLTTVSVVSEQILTLLKELEVEDPETHQGLIADCYRNTVFPAQIQQVSQFPRRRPPQSTRLGALLDAGYNMYDIHYVAKATDPEEVELRNYAIYTTPEKFISSLAEKNLVFALSATADIERCVNHFNLRWLGARDGINLLLPDKEDAEIVNTLNTKKSNIRNNQISVIRLDDLDNRKPNQKQIRRFINTAFQMDGFGNDTKAGHLRRRVERFFSSLLVASECEALEGEVQSHLMFLNSYRDIENFFKNPALWSASFYQIRHLEDRQLFTTYEIDFKDHTFTVVFYNAEQSKRIRQTSRAVDEFNGLFHGPNPVVVITQYLTAGNGVNLQYKLSNGYERDFLNLYLLEVPYFYFSAVSHDDIAEERATKLKENLWYLAKLHTSKFMSESEFRAKLSTLHKPTDWNNTYQHHPRMSFDYQLNSLAALIQALGRIERVWESIPNQTVVLCREAFHIFQRFLSSEFDDVRLAREPMISSNLKAVMEAIQSQIPQQERAARMNRDPQLAQLDTRCRQSIQELLRQFTNVRSGADDGKLRSVWYRMRVSALRHDFADGLLDKLSAVYTSPNVHNGEIFLNQQLESLPLNHDQPDTQFWRLNAVYDEIGENHIIREHFAKNGFELDFDLDGQDCFVPYFYQAILSGAIGEEAITALLIERGFSVGSLPSELFEVADLKIIDKPWYIDCKNYSDSTMERFLLGPDDYGFYHKFSENYFKQRAITKWQMISEFENYAGKLIFINTATTHDRLLQYYKHDADELIAVHAFTDADIIIVPGALVADNPNQYHQSFIRLLNDMESQYE